MKLVDALRINNAARRNPGRTLPFNLLTGFTPLHLQTLLAAALHGRLPGAYAHIATGWFGDLAGNIERANTEDSVPSSAIVIEWSDLDARLGWRALGGWSHLAAGDVLSAASASADRIVAGVQALATRAPLIVLALPSAPLPPIGHTPRSRWSNLEVAVHGVAIRIAERLMLQPNVRLLNLDRLARLSAIDVRADLAGDLATGFPYSMHHAAVIAGMIADIMIPVAPKKGLITDLDDTLWRGIVGDDGLDGIANTLESKAQEHGLFQQLLAALADQGVLLAVASKNDPAIADRALRRDAQVIDADRFFPVHATWEPKSESVARILTVWNVGPESVVFVDDSELELAEVKSRYPEMECLRFPRGDAASVVELLWTLRDRFGAHIVEDEDRLRLSSIRNAEVLRTVASGSASQLDDFLASLSATLTITLDCSADDSRSLQLINKTNQFNLNGRRLSDDEWAAFFRLPGAVRLTADYSDKFGSLGRIAVMLVEVQHGSARIVGWVMSCRSFSRRIEYACLRAVFTAFDLAEVQIEFQPTSRNGPLALFLEKLLGAPPAPGMITLSRELFEASAPVETSTVTLHNRMT